MPYIFVEKEGGGFDVRELPHVSDVGLEEAWGYNVKDMVDDHSARRARQADASQKEVLRGGRLVDDFKQKLDQQYIDHRERLFDAAARQQEEQFDLRQQLKAQTMAAFNTAMMHANERLGINQHVGAQNMQWDPQRVAESAVEAGLANASQTQGAAQSTMSAGMANQAWTQSAVQSAIAADVAETLRESVVAMGAAIADAVIAALTNNE